MELNRTELDELHAYAEGKMKYTRTSILYYKSHELACIVNLNVSYVVVKLTSNYRVSEIVDSINHTFKYYQLENLKLLSGNRYTCNSVTINFVDSTKFDDLVARRDCIVIEM